MFRSSYSRPGFAVKVICPKSMALTFVPGFAQCGVFVTLRASRRTWARDRPESRNVRNRLASRLAYPGPPIAVRFGCSEPRLRHGSKRRRVEPGLAGSNATQHLERRRLRRRAEGYPARSTTQRSHVIVIVEPEKAVKYALSLPASDDGGGHTVGEIALAEAEGQFVRSPRGRAYSETTVDSRTLVEISVLRDQDGCRPGVCPFCQ